MDKIITETPENKEAIKDELKKTIICLGGRRRITSTGKIVSGIKTIRTSYGTFRFGIGNMR